VNHDPTRPPPVDDPKERKFYIVMHHMASVLWMKGRSVEAVDALLDVLGDAKENRQGHPAEDGRR